VPENRAYGVGVERALYLLSRGTCYYPGCVAPAIVFVEDRPVCNLDIAHIHGANLNSARYDHSMSDRERASFVNLLLLCRPHHRLVDQIDPSSYSAETLREWKSAREAALVGEGERLGSPAPAFDGSLLSSGGVLEDMIEQYVKSHAVPARMQSIEIRGGGSRFDDDKMVTEGLYRWRASVARAGYPRDMLFLVIKVRNIGSLESVVQSVHIHVRVDWSDGTWNEALAFDFANLPNENSTPLPCALASGHASRWFFPLSAAKNIIDRISAALNQPSQITGELTGFFAQAQFQSREAIRTDIYDVSVLPFEYLPTRESGKPT
jgi:hypothetical protein